MKIIWIFSKISIWLFKHHLDWCIASQKYEHFETCNTTLTSLDQSVYMSAMLNAVSWNYESKWPNDLEVQGQWRHFNCQPWESQDAYLAHILTVAQICSMSSCGQGKGCGQTDGHRQWQYPYCLKGQGEFCPGSHYWNYFTGVLSFSQDEVKPLKLKHEQII